MIRISDKRGLPVGYVHTTGRFYFPQESTGEYTSELTLYSFDLELAIFNLSGRRGGDIRYLGTQHTGLLRDMVERAIDDQTELNNRIKAAEDAAGWDDKP